MKLSKSASEPSVPVHHAQLQSNAQLERGRSRA
jgi:hypothetical protein